jgi:hypothetical protein
MGVSLNWADWRKEFTSTNYKEGEGKGSNKEIIPEDESRTLRKVQNIIYCAIHSIRHGL